MAVPAARPHRPALSMAAVFSDLDDSLLSILAALPTRRTPRPRGLGMRHNGRVVVRYEIPSAELPASRHELLKAAAEQQQNWAWGKEHN